MLDIDDSENVDPLLSAKRSKGAKTGTPSKDFIKPSGFTLTRAIATPRTDILAPTSPTKPTVSTTPRRTLQPKSPAARLNTNLSHSSPVSAPAGRSPTRGKRSGILSNRRRTAGPYSRVDPPAFNLGSGGAPFSLDAALKGTIPSYGARPKAPSKDALADLHEAEMKPSWFFDIHEDTPEQEMTNLLQHSTCVLDISSDEESEQKAKRDRDEGRDKENVPPLDDVSQTSARRAPRLSQDDMIVEKERVALGEMHTADFYADGCDESSVVIVHDDEEEQPEQHSNVEQSEAVEHDPIVKDFEFAPELKSVEPVPEPTFESQVDIDVLMSKADDGSSKAAVLQPIEGTDEIFELWESGSSKDETEIVAEAS